jgi:hypothetical protein
MQKKRSAKKKTAKPKPRAKPTRPVRPADPADFAAAFEGLKRVMSAVEPELLVTTNEPHKYYLVTRARSWKGGPMYFGAVMKGKAYVSYHLFPLYVFPEMRQMVSPSLKKRMQGKTCFNFAAPDAALFAELSDLTRAGLEKYRAKNWL